MKQNDKLHGFTVTRISEVGKIGTLYEMVYEKNGARLSYFERDDHNKTFSIAFKTIPEDDTGVFHIIEHSVLCGSEKFPVKEPFVELLKSSLNTFLNAMTFDDKTMYPVASKNEKDFLNLVEVYLDAVFAPKILTKPEIFYQEGWHYELTDKDAELTYKGVVFNEMKGAYSAADQLVYRYMPKLLAPNTCYSNNSGGDPEAIPNLTYEQFIASYKRYYHPSNSYIFLDGIMDLSKVLPLIDSYLSRFERAEVDATIPMQPVIPRVEKTFEYEVGAGEDESGKARLALGKVVARFDEPEKCAAYAVISDILAGSNEAPLKKALLGAGLCEDVSMSLYDGIQQNAIVIEAKNAKVENLSKIEEIITESLKAASEGFDKERLHASVKFAEFKAREADFGSAPAGLIYAMGTLETQLYGGDPTATLDKAAVYASLYEKIDTGYFEDLVRELLSEENSAKLTLLPSKTLADERLAAEKARLAAARASWSEAELEEVLSLNESLLAWQKSEDSEEALKTLPTLTLDDISRTPEDFTVEEGEILGERTLLYRASTNGIVYADLFFPLTDLSEEEISLASFLSTILGNLPTEKYGTIELQDEVKKNLGALKTAITTYTGKGGDVTPYMVLSASALEADTDKLVELCREVILATDFSDKKLLRDILKQSKLATEMSFVEEGHSVAITRASAAFSAQARIDDLVDGVGFLSAIRALDESFDSTDLGARLASLARRIFTRDGATVALIGEENPALAEKLMKMLPVSNKKPKTTAIMPLGARREAIIIPAQVAYASICANLNKLGFELTGSQNVARNIVSYSYLWNVVRVQGGAYGAGMIVRQNGDVGYYSFRDPTPARTLEAYHSAGKFLSEFAQSTDDFTKFVIGAVGDAEPLRTPRTAGTLAFSLYFGGVTHADTCRRRAQLVETGREDLLTVAKLLDAVAEGGSVVVVGGKDKINEADFDEVISI